jgi:hypothetical protein
MNKQDLYIQTPVELMKLGLPPRLLDLYGRIRLYSGKDGTCFAKQSTLAKEIGITSDRQIRNLLDQLRRLRLIEWTDGACHAPNTYRVLRPDRKWISGLTGKGFPASGRKNISGIKEESSSSEESKRGPYPPNPPSPTAGASARRPKATAEQPRANANANGNASNFDDDENATPEQRFEARLLKRHGYEIRADTTIKTVKSVLANYAGVSFADFLAFDREHTTGNVKNPGGYYRRLAEKCGRHYEEQRAAAHMAATANATGNANVPRDAKGRCAKCGGAGTLKSGGYCECPMGRDLAKALAAKRKPQRESKPEPETTMDYSKF